MKGNIGIFIIIGVLLAIFLGFLFFKTFMGPSRPPSATPSPSPQSFSEDPRYKDVKEKYNLSEEQLQILSTVNPEDNQ